MKRTVSILLIFLMPFFLITTAHAGNEATYNDRDTKFIKGLLCDTKTGTPITGIVQEYLPETNTLVSEIHYTNGKGNGLTKAYYDTGELMAEMYFIDGQKTGEWKHYYESGQLRSVETYKDGQNNGPYKQYNEEGTLILELLYKDNMVQSGYSYGEHGEKTKLTDEQIKSRNSW